MFIKAPVQHFGAYFCLGNYLLILKTRIKVTINIEYWTFNRWSVYHRITVFIYIGYLLYLLYILIKSAVTCKRDILKEMWPLDLWWISNKTIMDVRNITKAATFKSFIHLSHKNTQLLFLWQCLLIYSDIFGGLLKNWIAHFL